MNIHMHNIGDCQKCGLLLSNLNNSNIKINLTDDPNKTDLLIIIGCSIKTQEKPLLDYWEKAANIKILLLGSCAHKEHDLFTFKNPKIKNLALSGKDLNENFPIDIVLEGCPPSIEELSNFLENFEDLLIELEPHS